MSEERIINIARDFSDVPSGRRRIDGPASGEAFREDILKGVLQNHKRVVVELDGTEGYGSSFLEEAFGGLIRKKYISKKNFRDRLVIEAKNDAYKHYQSAAYRYIEKAEPEN